MIPLQLPSWRRTRRRDAGDTPPPRRRRLRRALIVAGLVIGGVGAAAAPSMAISLPIFGDCKTAPTPASPNDGVAGWLISTPNPLPKPGNAFGPNATTTEFAQYGYAGLTWSTYDQGCVTLPTSMGAQWYTDFADLVFSGATGIVALDNTLHSYAADPTWVHALGPILEIGTSALHTTLFVVWGGVVLVIIGLSIFIYALRSDTPKALTTAVWMLMVVAMVGAVVTFPTAVTNETAAIMGTTIDAMDAGFVGPGGQQAADQAHSSLMVSSVLYPGWLRGEFGTSTSATATKYGGPLFTAGVLSWSQTAGTPAQVAAAEKKTEANFKTVAGQVQKADPQAYDNLKGNAGSRVSDAVLTIATALITCLFDIFCSLVVIVALLSVAGGIMLLPGLATVGMHYQMRSVITNHLSRMAGRVLAGILYAGAAGIDQVATRILLTHATLPMPLTLTLLALLPVGLYVSVRRVRGYNVIPRPAMVALGFLGLRRGLSQGAERGVERALHQQYAHFGGDQNTLNVNLFDFRGQQWGGQGWSYQQPQPTANSVGGGGGGGGGLGGGAAALGGGPSGGGPNGGGPSGGGGPRPSGGGPNGGGGPRPSGGGPNGGGGPRPSGGGGPRPGGSGPAPGGPGPSPNGGGPAPSTVRPSWPRHGDPGMNVDAYGQPAGGNGPAGPADRPSGPPADVPGPGPSSPSPAPASPGSGAQAQPGPAAGGGGHRAGVTDSRYTAPPQWSTGEIVPAADAISGPEERYEPPFDPYAAGVYDGGGTANTGPGGPRGGHP